MTEIASPGSRPARVRFPDGERIYGEVEFGYGKEGKWRNMQDALGYAACWARSPGHERAFLEEWGEIRKRVYITNLTRLITREGTFWEEKRQKALGFGNDLLPLFLCVRLIFLVELIYS